MFESTDHQDDRRDELRRRGNEASRARGGRLGHGRARAKGWYGIGYWQEGYNQGVAMARVKESCEYRICKERSDVVRAWIGRWGVVRSWEGRNGMAKKEG